MNLRNILVPVGLLILFFAAHRAYGWQGVFAVGGGVVMWLLLHFHRLMGVLKKAADRPVGYVGSAVMLNAKLKPGVNLMHVVAMTRALGELRSPQDEQPEIYRWTDGTQSWVDCEFQTGRLVRWELHRPQSPAEGDAEAPTAASAP